MNHRASFVGGVMGVALVLSLMVPGRASASDVFDQWLRQAPAPAVTVVSEPVAEVQYHSEYRSAESNTHSSRLYQSPQTQGPTSTVLPTANPEPAPTRPQPQGQWVPGDGWER